MNAELLMLAVIFASVAPLAFRWRRRYIAIVMALLLLGPFSLIPDVARAEVLAPRLIRVDKGPGPPYCSDYERLRRFEALPPPGVLFIEAYNARVTFTFMFANLTSTSYGGRPAYRMDLWMTASSDRSFTANEWVSAELKWSAYWGSGSIDLGDAGDNMPIDRVFSITIPADAIYTLELIYWATGAPFYCGDYARIHFILTEPLATNRTAVSLVTKYMFKTGFGLDNPIDYKGPRLPPGVEQKITGFEMLPETMYIRQYSMHLLPDWAVRGEIASGLLGVMYARPSNIFGFGVPDQDWVEPPTAYAVSPNEVVLRGKIRSGYNPFFNQRVPFPFAPYYEFPTILEIPLDQGRPGGGVLRGLENATFIMEMRYSVDDSVFMSPPWFEEGDVVSYVYPVSAILSSLPFIPKMRSVFARLKHLPDELDRIFAQRGETPPAAAREDMLQSIRDALGRLLREETASSKVHVDDIPRIPPRSELQRMPAEERVAFEQIADTLASTRDTARVVEGMAAERPILRTDSFFNTLKERVLDKFTEVAGVPPGDPRYIEAGYLLNLANDLDSGVPFASAVEKAVTKVFGDIAGAPDPAARQLYYQAASYFVRDLSTIVSGLADEVGTAFREAFTAFLSGQILKSLESAIGRITIRGVPESLAVRNLRPKAWTEEVTYTTLDMSSLALSLAIPAAGTASAVAWVAFYVSSLGVSLGHAFVGNKEWLDPTGITMAGAVAFKVKTPSGVRLAYISVAPNIGFGLFGSGYSASDIVDQFVAGVSRSLGYGSPARISRVVGSGPSEVAGVLNTMSWSDLDQLIAAAVGSPASQIKLVGIAVMPVYIPYTNTAAYRVGKSYVFDFSDSARAIKNIGITADLVGIVPGTGVDDPNTMLTILNPISINGATVGREQWSIVRTTVGTAVVQRPRLSYPLDVRTVGSPSSLLVEALNKAPFTSVARVNVTQEFIWDPLRSSGGFGVPCISGEKLFRGFFQVLNIRFYRYPVVGDSPPDKVVFTLRAENATVQKVYGSDLMEFSGASIVVRGDAFIWIKVGEDQSLGLSYWDGELKRVDDLPVFRFVLGCGYGFDVNLGERDATRGAISGSVAIDGSGMAGTATLPTKAIFNVKAFRPPSQPTPPSATVRMVVGYYQQEAEGGPKWVETPIDETRSVTSFPASFERNIGDIVAKALDLANKTGKPVILRAMMTISGAPPGYSVSQPSPATWVAQPTSLPGRTWTLTVRVVDSLSRAAVANATVLAENKTHTFTNYTGADGLAVFRLTTGSYSVRVTKAGYLPSEARQVNLVNDTLVELLLHRAATGNATVTVRAYDAETGSPVSGASVSLDSRTGTTDGSGRVTFTDVPFGSYRLEVVKSGYTPYSRDLAVNNSTLTVDAPLIPERTKVDAVVTVLNSVTGAPVQGATVQFENGTMVYTGTTDASGVARINLPFGGYTLRVSASGFYPFSQTVFVPATGFSTTVRLTPTSVEPRPPKPPTPPEACDIQLTIVEVKDAATGSGVPGARVTLVRGGFTYTADTDSNGEARFCITSGIYGFRAEKAGYQTAEGSSFIAEGSRFTIVLTPLSQVPSGRLNILVVDAANGAPVPGADVSVANSTKTLTGTTDSSGRASFLLTAGGYLLTVRKTGYLDFSADVEFRGVDTNYTVSLTRHGMCDYPGNWTEPAPCGYRWLVVDVRYRDGYPFAGASVTVQNSTYTRTVTTDGTGKAKFLLSPGSYSVTVQASRGSQTFTASFTVTLDQNIWKLVITPWYSPYYSPEVFPLYVSFAGPRRGVWNETHIIALAVFSNAPQTVSIRVSAINFTRYAADRTIQVLNSTVLTMNFSNESVVTAVVPLEIRGRGFALVAPVAEIISYQNDTDTENNRLVGQPIPFGPLLDISVRILVEVESATTGALVPELTRMRLTVEVWSNIEVDVPGTAVLGVRFVSAENGAAVERTLNMTAFRPRTSPHNVTVSYVLEWTNVTLVVAGVSHELEVNEIDNNQTAVIRLDRAIKLVSVRAPASVRSGSAFNVSITVLSNQWPSWEYSYLSRMDGAVATGFFRAGYGRTNVTVRAAAPPVSGVAPVAKSLNVTVGPDFAPQDNSAVVTVLVIPETLAVLSPWLLLLLAVLVAVLGAVAVSRASRRAQVVYRSRRVIRSAESWPEPLRQGLEPSEWTGGDSRRHRRRVLR